MSSKKIIRTAWGSKQIAVPNLPELSREEEIMLRQEWKTPPNFWSAVNAEFGFAIDVAASEENSLCDEWVDVEEDALSGDSMWIDPSEHLYTAYCNPGFNNMLPWIEKAFKQSRRHKDAIVCVLGLCAPSTSWWAEAVNLATEIRLLSPRVQFQAPDPRIPQSSNARDCALFIFRGFKIDHDATIVTWRWR